MLTFVHESRVDEGVAPVTPDPTLARVAQERAATLAEQPGTLSHQEPDGQLAFAHLLSEANADCWLAGENLARGEDGEDLAARLHARLMESGPHRANILDGAFNAAGIGLARDADGWVVLTEIFCAH
jgi:uncharacterized protein YkwD